jgi:hypothetical protein
VQIGTRRTGGLAAGALFDVANYGSVNTVSEPPSAV